MREGGYKNYVLAVLMTILALSFVDRLALGLLLQDLKVDLELSDTQLGLLSGFAFALFYSVMGIPIARWADCGNRVVIITVTTTLWSVAVILFGLAGNFLQLTLIRIVVAVGQAGCIPPALSLIADYFTRAERPKAIAIYMLGVPLSMVIAYLAAGWLNELYGWRVTFTLLGLPGLGVAACAWFTVREPRLRRARAPVIRSDGLARCESSVSFPISWPKPTLKEVCLTFWASATFRHLMLFFILAHFFGYGISQWSPAYFLRSFELDTGALGTWLSIIHGLAGFLGTFVGGEWATRRAAHNERLQLKATALAYSSFGVLSAGIFLSSDPYLAFGFLGLAALGGYATIGPLFATIQTLVPDRMRAMSIAFIYLFANLIGMGLGPSVAGVLSDVFRTWAGEESLRYALLALCPGYFWCGWHLWRGSTTVTRDLEAAQINEDAVVHEPAPAN